MNDQPLHPPVPATEIEDRARRAGISIRSLCAHAGIAQSTFWRWKQGGSTTTDIYARIVSSLDEMMRQGDRE